VTGIDESGRDLRMIDLCFQVSQSGCAHFTDRLQIQKTNPNNIMQINQIEGDNHKWGNGNTTTFDIIKIEKDESKENCVFVETKSHRFRLYHLVSDGHFVLLSVNELEKKDNGNILVQATHIVGENIVKHPFCIGLPLTIAGAGLSATLAGFGAAGIAGGSIAALIQSGIGNVAAGSLFATMQSLGATGTFTAMTTGGLVTAGASGAAVAITSSDGENKKENEDHVKTSSADSKEVSIDDLKKLVGSKVMIVKDKELVICH
jgi:hypothetical protein